MLLAYDKIKQERRSGIIKIIILIIVCISCLCLSVSVIHKNGLMNTIQAENRPDHPKFIQITNAPMEAWLNNNGKEEFRTSISFYNIVGNDQKFPPGQDLRGKFWEFQIKDYSGTTAVNYISNGPLTTNNITFEVLTDNQQTHNDKQFCQRTPNTWKHFVEKYPDYRWYFRGTHDTFVNWKYLLELIQELESKYDPMKEVALAYNCHEYNHKLYPHGGTGYLFSNFAVRQFLKRESEFRSICLGSADDVAFNYFLQIQSIKVEDWMSNKFIVTWPNTETDIIMKRQYERVAQCPKVYRLFSNAAPMLPCPCRTAASIHMHRVPMPQAWEILQNTPKNFAVTYLNPDTPTFCKLSK
ncbi:hypothetical protein TVAG_240710 [Trichomonas vaginalis G3]|uniref:Uncharacterized protein n=1 Tax=Trichomonas vaginalis (strain ATCC PRA-98 / G3) TaxID=412133 RepID=A2EJB8_TRIV3|nr:beta1,3-galactosyltransferase family [Trichomonas vaginalis G3]EAY07270.1 hypothetical protein TVAG_240710 [Trichomonas vaginalis G3]KAI5511958.1 beta1,3-galactosyltransferase family [Trichomonas vaginalis G3]|eukprot:XP_001319493.1 hypothetical protein [Trichomonas vaginalis G3]